MKVKEKKMLKYMRESICEHMLRNLDFNGKIKKLSVQLLEDRWKKWIKDTVKYMKGIEKHLNEKCFETLDQYDSIEVVFYQNEASPKDNRHLDQIGRFEVRATEVSSFLPGGRIREFKYLRSMSTHHEIFEGPEYVNIRDLYTEKEEVGRDIKVVLDSFSTVEQAIKGFPACEEWAKHWLDTELREQSYLPMDLKVLKKVNVYFNKK